MRCAAVELKRWGKVLMMACVTAAAGSGFAQTVRCNWAVLLRGSWVSKLFTTSGAFSKADLYSLEV